MSMESLDVVIVGGGPAGLATSQQLGIRGISNVVLERGDRAGWMWGHVYDGLRLHTGKHLSALPGMAFPSRTSLFPTLSEFTSYISGYADKFALPVRVCTEVTGLRQDDGGWLVETTQGEYWGRSVAVSTGIMSAPVVPDFPGMPSYGGRIFHSTEYRRPDDRTGQRVLVVGIGNSGSEIASEMAEAGTEVTLSVRSGANVIPRSIAGVPSQYFGWMMSRVPMPVQRRVVRGMGLIGGLLRPRSARLPRKQVNVQCQDVPVIGRGILDHITAGRVTVRPGVADMNEGGVRFSDGSEWVGEQVILATGYRAAIGWMGAFGARDECGFGERRDRVCSANYPGLYFIGHNYDGRGGLYNIRIDAKRVARLIASRSYRR